MVFLGLNTDLSNVYMPDAQQYITLFENSKYRWDRKYPAWNRKRVLWDDHVLSDQKSGVSNGGLACSVALLVISRSYSPLDCVKLKGQKQPEESRKTNRQ